MNNEDFTLKHIGFYFLCFIIGMINLVIAYQIYKGTDNCPVKAFLLPLILGVILVVGFIVGIMFFSVYEDDDKPGIRMNN